MYFWNTRALARELKARKLSQREKMKYLLACTVAGTGLIWMVFWSPQPEAQLPLILADLFVPLVIGIWGVLFCYRANRHGDNEEFFDRFICISWPVGVRFLVLLFPLALVGYVVHAVVAHITTGDRFDPTVVGYSWIDLLFMSGWTLLYFWRIQLHLKNISSTTTSSTTEPAQ